MKREGASDVMPYLTPKVETSSISKPSTREFVSTKNGRKWSHISAESRRGSVIESRRSMDDRLQLDKAPSPELVIKDSKGQKIHKLCGLAEWTQRFICVTEDRFVIMNSEGHEIADQIPLVD